MATVTILGVPETTNQPKLAPALEAASLGLQRALEVFSGPDFESKEGWKKKDTQKGMSVLSAKKSFGKVYNVRAEFSTPLVVLLEDHWKNFENTVNWNKNVSVAKILATISDNADVIQVRNNVIHFFVKYATDDVLMVKGKEFIVGRVRREHNGIVYVAASSFDAPQVPPIKGKSKATANCIAGRFVATAPNKTVVDFLVSVDFKDSNIPKNLVNKAIAAMTLGDAIAAKKYVDEKLSH